MEHNELIPLSGASAVPPTDSLEAIWEEAGVPMAAIMKLNIALDEIFSNIVKFSGATYARIGCKVEDGAATLLFEDDGTPYDPLTQQDPDTGLSAEERDVGGLGIFMVKKLMTSVTYVHQEGKNILTLTYRFD